MTNTLGKNRSLKYVFLFGVLVGLNMSCNSTRSEKNINYSGVYQNLEFGEHAVGFKIIKIYDKTRYAVNDRNLFGEPIEGNRYRPVYIHLWYPAVSSGDHLTFGEYATFSETNSANLKYTDQEYINATNLHKSRVTNYHGQVPDSAWVQLMEEPVIAQRSPELKAGSFPLLIGHLRSFSTDITNEYLASHGYVVAHIRNRGDYANMQNPDGVARETIDDYRDMEVAMAHLKVEEMVDPNRVGTFGFSGSGFAQVHLAMMNPDIDAIADLESGYFMEGLWEWLNASPTFNNANLNIPFLHIFSDTLSQEEIWLGEFRTMNYSDRYRLILNEPPHHWDFATEGFISAGYLGMRGEIAEPVIESFKISNLYLKEFFDAFVKNETEAKQFLTNDPSENGLDNALVEMEHIPPQYQTPTLNELVYAMDQENFEEVKTMTIQSLKSDTASGLEQQASGLNLLAFKYSRVPDLERTIAVAEILHVIEPGSDAARSQLDNLGYRFLNEGDEQTAIRIFKKNMDLNEGHHIPYYSLGDAYVRSGMDELALTIFEQGLELANEVENYPENLLNAHKRAFKIQIDKLNKVNE